MKKSIMKIVSTSLIALFLISCFILPASAHTAYTNTYYVYQEKSYGRLTLTSSQCTPLTYCELTSAGKIAAADLVYKKSGRTYVETVQSGNYNNSTYVYNSSTTTSKTRNVGSGETYFSASSFHKVKISSYIVWDSVQCDGNNNGHDIPEITILS